MPQQCKCATNTGSDDSKCLRVLKSLSKILIFKNVDIQKEKNSQFQETFVTLFYKLSFPFSKSLPTQNCSGLGH